MHPNEICALLDGDGNILWMDASTSPVALPDSRARWEAIWRHREDLAGIAHTHPSGLLAFSNTDTTTMAAIDAALGRRLQYTIVTPTGMLHRDPDGQLHTPDLEPAWVARLRKEGEPWPS
jgi:proteasome lid subunit RPN8/RPN11